MCEVTPGHQGDLLLEGVGEDELAVLQLELFLDPTGDEEVAVLIQSSPVPRPEGAVVKRSAVDDAMLRHTGPARVFDSEEPAMQAILEGRIQKGDVVVIRYEGPKGGPGMREMLSPTSAIVGIGRDRDVALLTDGRFSGGSRGAAIGHISPEAAEGAPSPWCRRAT